VLIQKRGWNRPRLMQVAFPRLITIFPPGMTTNLTDQDRSDIPSELL
jgi:hypothetical protein